MMSQVVKEGTGTPRRSQGIDGRGQDRNRRDDPSARRQPGLVHRLCARRRSRDRGRRDGRADERRRAARSPRRSPRGRWSSCCRERQRWLARARDRSSTAATALVAQDRLGWDGRRLLRRGHRSRPPGRDQAPPPPLRAGQRVRRALSPRGPSAAGLQHPNVVGVFDRGEFDGTYYIAMEYCEGDSLKDLINDGMTVARRGRGHAPDPRGRALRPQKRHHPPRHEAPERPHRRRRASAGHRLRHRPRRQLGDHPDRLGDGNRPVPLARAGAGPGGDGRRPISTRPASSSSRP